MPVDDPHSGRQNMVGTALACAHRLVKQWGWCNFWQWAAQFVSTPFWELLQDLMRNSATYIGAARDPNLQYVLVKLGLTAAALPLSIGIWFALGLWIWRYRTTNIWLLLAVTTLVMRFWSYHRVYDNVFLLIPEIAFWRLIHSQTKTKGSNSFATVLLAVNVLVILAPANAPSLPGWLAILIQAAQGVTWRATLLYFLVIVLRLNAPSGGQTSFSGKPYPGQQIDDCNFTFCSL